MRFNTQPPEGGWGIYCTRLRVTLGFNTQPPEGGWRRKPLTLGLFGRFQHTAARRRLGYIQYHPCSDTMVSTHSRPKAAGQPANGSRLLMIRFNTQPPEGGWQDSSDGLSWLPSFNTQPPEGGWSGNTTHDQTVELFQHTAARRRLDQTIACFAFNFGVSTHSRPKAAGNTFYIISHKIICFNTQPPEGGWVSTSPTETAAAVVSTHSRPKAAGQSLQT